MPMEPLEILRQKIAEFPGYDDDVERRRSDEYVRSYLGEALTAFAERCTLSADLRTRLDELVLQVAFSDPRDFVNHHIVAPKGATDGGGAVAAADVEAVELADRAATLDCAAAAAYLDEVEALLARRETAIRAQSAR
jgi:hypothetical protein